MAGAAIFIVRVSLVFPFFLTSLVVSAYHRTAKVGLMHDRQTSRDGFGGEFDAQVLQRIILYG